MDASEIEKTRRAGSLPQGAWPKQTQLCEKCQGLRKTCVIPEADLRPELNAVHTKVLTRSALDAEVRESCMWQPTPRTIAAEHDPT